MDDEPDEDRLEEDRRAPTPPDEYRTHDRETSIRLLIALSAALACAALAGAYLALLTGRTTVEQTVVLLSVTFATVMPLLAALCGIYVGRQDR